MPEASLFRFAVALRFAPQQPHKLPTDSCQVKNMLYTFNQYTKCACRYSYLGNEQLQLHHVFWLGHRGLRAVSKRRIPFRSLPTAQRHNRPQTAPYPRLGSTDISPGPQVSCHKTHIEGERVIISAQCQYLDALLH